MSLPTFIFSLLAAIFVATAVLALVEFRKLSRRMGGFLASSEKQLAEVVQDSQRARARWERLADSLEEASQPLVRLGETARLLEADVVALREQYREGVLSASRKVGWAVGAIREIQHFVNHEAPVASSTQGDRA